MLPQGSGSLWIVDAIALDYASEARCIMPYRCEGASQRGWPPRAGPAGSLLWRFSTAWYDSVRHCSLRHGSVGSVYVSTAV